MQCNAVQCDLLKSNVAPCNATQYNAMHCNVCMYVCIYIIMYIYICTYIYIHTYIHIYIYVYKFYMYIKLTSNVHHSPAYLSKVVLLLTASKMDARELAKALISVVTSTG